MGSFNIRRSKTITGIRVQLGRRLTASKHLGPITMSSTGKNSIRLARGVRYRFGRGWRKT